jgi:hypothetical protein
MNNNFKASPVRIPVRLVDGAWEYFDGRGLPIMDGARGTLVIDKHAVLDEDFLDHLTRRSAYKILPEGTELLVALTIKPEPGFEPGIEQHLLGAHDVGVHPIGHAQYRRLSSSTRFVKVQIGQPTEIDPFESTNESGGVWLLLEGAESKSLRTSQVMLPPGVSPEPAISLNHAYTLLSEKYEPWRKAHTGNIYQQVFYEEKNKQWYPLEIPRRAAIAEDEHQLVREWWAAISSELGLTP